MEILSLKDQQINSQKETIESLERNIRSLEKELQRCLDPDSGEIKPEFKQRTSETVSIRTNATQSARLDYLITNIAAGLFMPFERYNDFTKKNETEHKLHLWSRLMYIFTERPEFDHFWTSRSFRSVMHNVVQICNYMQTAKNNDYKGDQLELAAEYFCHGVTTQEHEGTLLLKEAIEKLYLLNEQDRMDLESEEIDDLFFSVQIMIQCQRLSRAMKMNEKEN